MFCRNCGKELNSPPDCCPGCGANTLNGNKYCQSCGSPTDPIAEICVKCGIKLMTKVEGINVSPKSRLITTLLAFFLGVVGGHRFYTGNTITGIIMVVLTIIGWATVWWFIGFIFILAVGIWAFIDFIIAALGEARDSEGRIITNW
jgi:TM2 domain-containing membrane protein YozV